MKVKPITFAMVLLMPRSSAILIGVMLQPEIITKKGEKIERYGPRGRAEGKGSGKRIGTAYQLESVQII